MVKSSKCRKGLCDKWNVIHDGVIAIEEENWYPSTTQVVLRGKVKICQECGRRVTDLENVKKREDSYAQDDRS